jgi:hypothetical protein
MKGAMMRRQKRGMSVVIMRAGTTWLAAVILTSLVLCPLASAEAVDPQHPHDPPLPGDWGKHGGFSRFPFRVGGNNQWVWYPAVIIATANPYFNIGHNVNSTGQKVEHLHFRFDYGSVGPVTVQMGNDYWDWYYMGYTPAVVRETDATNVTNCFCYAYDQYKTEGTLAKHWVNDPTPYTSELTVVHPMGVNKLMEVEPEDRCHNPDHAWVIVDDPWREHMATYRIRWKNNSSGVYRWFHEPECNNDCPSGRGAFYTVYWIYRR